MVVAAAGQPQPYAVDGPATLVANLTANGNRRVLHLTNWTGDGFEKTHVSHYYVAPVENVKIRIPAAAKNVRSYPAKGLRQQPREAALELTLPRVADYQAITWIE